MVWVYILLTSVQVLHQVLQKKNALDYVNLEREILSDRGFPIQDLKTEGPTPILREKFSKKSRYSLHKVLSRTF